MRPSSSRAPRKFCSNCRIRPVDYPRCICLFCEQEQREIDHDIIVRAQVFHIVGGEARSEIPRATPVAPSGRPILTLRKLA